LAVKLMISRERPKFFSGSFPNAFWWMLESGLHRQQSV
jgi:hypothetical protein